MHTIRYIHCIHASMRNHYRHHVSSSGPLHSVPGSLYSGPCQLPWIPCTKALPLSLVPGLAPYTKARTSCHESLVPRLSPCPWYLVSPPLSVVPRLALLSPAP